MPQPTQIPIQITVDDSGLDGLQAEIRAIGTESRNAASAYGKATNEIKKDTQTTESQVGKLSSAMRGLGPAIAAGLTIGAVASFGKAIFDVTARYQSMQTVLTTTLGSQKKAADAFDNLNQLAAATPFSVEALLDAFNKLTSRGLPATNEALTQLGDLASATGKDLDQLTEAVLDAVTGEFERLKEFGVKASKEGDKVKLTFKGITTTVANTQDAIFGYIASLGQLQGVQGGMAAQSLTLSGRLSTLSDNFNQLLGVIGTALLPVFGAAIDAASSFVGALKDAFSPTFEERLVSVEGKFVGLFNTVTSGTLTGEALQRNINDLNKEYGDYLPVLISVDQETGKLNITEEQTNAIREVAIKLLKQEVIQLQKRKVIEDLNAEATERAGKLSELLVNTTAALAQREQQLNNERAKGNANAILLEAMQLEINKLKQLEISLTKDLNAVFANTTDEIQKQSKAYDGLNDALFKNLTGAEQNNLAIVKENASLKKAAELLSKKANEKIAEAKAGAKEREKAAKEAEKLESARQKALLETERLQIELDENEFRRKLRLLEFEKKVVAFETNERKKQTPALAAILDEQNALKIKAIDQEIAAIIAAAGKLNTEDLLNLDTDKFTQDFLVRLQIIGDFFSEKLAESARKLKEEQKKQFDKQFELIGAAAGRLDATLQESFGFNLGLEKAIADYKTLVEVIKDAESTAEEKGAAITQAVATTLSGAAAAGIQLVQQASANALQQAEQDFGKQNELLSKAREQGLITEERYARELESIQKNKAAKEKAIRRKAAEDEKVLRVFQAVVSTAAAVASALTAGPIIGPILAGITAALGAIQIGIIVAQPLPKFRKGGPVGGKSHEQGGTMIEAERGEYVVNKEAAHEHMPILEAINSRNKGRMRAAFGELGFMPNAGPERLAIAGVHSIDYDRLAKAVTRELEPALARHQQQVNVHVNERGMSVRVKNQLSDMEYVNRYYNG